MVLRALPPTWGRSRSTPNGALGFFRSFLSSWICNSVDQVNMDALLRQIMRVAYLLTEDLGCVSNTANNTQTASVGDGSCELGASGNVHSNNIIENR